MVTISHIIEKAKKYNPQSSSSRLQHAFDFAERAHGSQMRKSGEPFIIHPLSVADALTEYNADEDTLIAALLHDVVEDTDRNLESITKQFGENVAFLVDSVTKVKKEVHKIASWDHKKESLRKLISSISKDQRVLLIKLLDRRHNLQTIGHLPPEKQQRKALETLYYYVPLAKSMSLWEIKTELENLGFSILKPVQYDHYAKLVEKLTHEHRKFFIFIKKTLRQAFASTNVPVKIDINVLTPYEMFELKQKSIDIKKHFFQIVVRTDSDEHCYSALGVIHRLWKPILKHFHDYIAVPKENHYQALHTSVICSKGQLLKILIQTKAMHQYSRKSAPFDHDTVHHLKTSLGHLNENDDSLTYLKSVKDEVFCEYVHFFDDQGNGYKLPQGISLIDFYYYLLERQKVPSSLAVLAEVNEHRSPFRSVIQNDDVINLSFGKNQKKISPFMLRYAKTSTAKKHIKKELLFLTQQEARNEGKKVLRDELKRTGLPSLNTFSPKVQTKLLKSLDLRESGELLEKLGRGTIDISRLLHAIYVLHCQHHLHRPLIRNKHSISMQISNNKNRVGFVKDVVDTFQKLHISIQEIKGYSPRGGKLGIVDLKIHERVTWATIRDVILPLCNALEQVESVSTISLNFLA